MNQQIRQHFSELKIKGQRFTMTREETREKDVQLIHYLKSVLENKEVTELEDVGFCYWNISDNYAMLRDGHAQMRNHQSFYDYIKNENSCYLYWLVCDATQRLTLEKDGYSDFWWALYREAIQRNEGTNLHFAEFNVHRAALYKNPIVSPSKSDFEYAIACFEKFLQKAEKDAEYRFYRSIYLSVLSRFSQVDKTELKHICEELFEGLSHTETASSFLCGEWRSFITPFDIRRQSVVGIISVINALIDGGEVQVAKELYQNAGELGLPKNAYVEKRLQ